MQTIPEIDLGPSFSSDTRARQEVAKHIDDACRHLGFLIVKGHGVDSELVARMHNCSKAFFSLENATKNKVALGKYAKLNGYSGIGMEKLDATMDDTEDDIDKLKDPQLIDIKESFNMGPSATPADSYYHTAAGKYFFETTPWPENPEDLKATWLEYWQAMDALASHLMGLFAIALDLPENYFSKKIDKQIGSLTVNRYPPLQSLESNWTRAGAHTDFGSLTILHTGDHPNGLQVYDRDSNRTDKWQDVLPSADSFVVNIGDLMARWTNDRWKSTLHRVVVGPDTAHLDRYSLTFFHQPNYDVDISCLPSCLEETGALYPSTTSGKHYAKKMSDLRGESMPVF